MLYCIELVAAQMCRVMSMKLHIDSMQEKRLEMKGVVMHIIIILFVASKNNFRVVYLNDHTIKFWLCFY